MTATEPQGASDREEIERLTRELDDARVALDIASRAAEHGWDVSVASEVRRSTAAYRELLAAIWLQVEWRSVTKHLTTEQRELWASAVEQANDPAAPVHVDRWWYASDGPAATT